MSETICTRCGGQLDTGYRCIKCGERSMPGVQVISQQKTQVGPVAITFTVGRIASKASTAAAALRAREAMEAATPTPDQKDA